MIIPRMVTLEGAHNFGPSRRAPQMLGLWGISLSPGKRARQAGDAIKGGAETIIQVHEDLITGTVGIGADLARSAGHMIGDFGRGTVDAVVSAVDSTSAIPIRAFSGFQDIVIDRAGDIVHVALKPARAAINGLSDALGLDGSSTKPGFSNFPVDWVDPATKAPEVKKKTMASTLLLLAGLGVAGYAAYKYL